MSTKKKRRRSTGPSAEVDIGATPPPVEMASSGSEELPTAKRADSASIGEKSGSTKKKKRRSVGSAASSARVDATTPSIEIQDIPKLPLTVAAKLPASPPPEEELPDLLKAALAGDTTMLATAVANGCDLKTTTTSGGHTALHLAAAHGNVEVVKELLAANAPVDQVTRFGQTPLHLVSILGLGGGTANGAYRCAELLLGARASPHARDGAGFALGLTPRELGIQRCAATELLELLLSAEEKNPPPIAHKPKLLPDNAEAIWSLLLPHDQERLKGRSGVVKPVVVGALGKL